MNLYKTGKFICNLRKEKKLSQRDLAESIPLTRQAISSWENGRSFPDSSVLKILANIFEVTTDELIAGERLVNEEQIESIKLDLVDEVNTKNKTIKNNIIISSLIIGILLLFFFGYYFFTSFNTIKVYKIFGEKNQYFTENGIFILTKQKSYLRIGSIKSKNNINIKNIKLYYLKNNKRQIIYDNDNTDILITEYFGYNEFFSYDDTKYIIKTLSMEITDENNKKEIVKLSVKKDFSNNLLMYIKEFNLLEKEVNHVKNENNLFTKSIKKIKEIGEENNNTYFYKSNDNKIFINYINNELILEIQEEDIKETWTCYLDYNQSFIYQKYKNNKLIKNNLISLKDTSKLNSTEKNLYLKLEKNLENYLLK